MPKLGPDYDVTVDVEGGGGPTTSLQISQTTRRIRVLKGFGWNVVHLEVSGDFIISMDRPLAEKLRDDLTRWLKKHPADTEADWRRMAGYED